WFHLLATVVWLGGLVSMAIIAWPKVRQRILSADQWVTVQKRFTPWANASLVILWVTGFLQMTADPNYEGFLTVDSLWAKAILIKHLAVIGMMIFGIYIQWRIQPALARLALLENKHPEQAADRRENLTRQEIRLGRLNLICAVAVLFFTAIATAI
ncbi:MAG TPA: CopD family protein, partial [candidate division Zixibacteria bacterium]|nr:CopD family protein [candidate division Zixibacteria bacterium]